MAWTSTVPSVHTIDVEKIVDCDPDVAQRFDTVYMLHFWIESQGSMSMRLPLQLTEVRFLELLEFIKQEEDYESRRMIFSYSNNINVDVRRIKEQTHFSLEYDLGYVDVEVPTKLLLEVIEKCRECVVGQNTDI